MEEERKLILDTETTGLNFEDDKIIEIGIVELRDNILTQNYFHEYINPDRDISLSAQRVHGITNDFLKDKPKFSSIAQRFLDFIKDDVIIIHNAEFDKNFINKELQECGLNNISNSLIDTISIAKREFPGQTVNLDSLCKKLDVTNSRQKYHGALLDATLLSKIYLRLTTGKQEDLDLMSVKLDDLSGDDYGLKYKDNFLIPRNQLMILSEEEKNKHKEFLAGMNDSIWKKLI